MKPTIRADKTELTVSDSKLSANNAIFVFEWPCMPLTLETFVTQVSNARYRTLKRCVVEASNVINDPKCNKGPKCNNFWP